MSPDLMAGFDKAIVSLLPAHERQSYRAMRAKQDEREAELIQSLRAHLFEAVQHVGAAGEAPRTSSWDISQAIAALLKAREAAQELDPPSAA